MLAKSTLSMKDRILQRLLRRIRPAVLATLIKRVIKAKRFPVETSHGIFFVDPFSLLGFDLCERNEYEPSMVSVLKARLRPGSIFVDAGANEGYFSVIAAQLVGPHGRVIAIEPQNRLLPIIEQNCLLNGVRDRVTIVNAAISDHPGNSHIFLTSDMNNGGSGLLRPTRYHLPTQEVAINTLNGILSSANVRQADLLKIDIEGYEYEAILGSPQLFREKAIRAIALELHPKAIQNRGLDTAHITSLLEECGYSVNRDFHNVVYCT